MANPTFYLEGIIAEKDKFFQIFTGEEEPGIVDIADLRDFISANSGAGEIDVVINSPGGDAQMGLDIHDILVNSGKVINTRVEGICYSAATPVLLAARSDRRSMLENSIVGIHLPYIPPYTLADSYTADELQSLADGMRVYENLYLKMYVDATGMSEEILREMMEKDALMSSEDARANGFISEIIKTNVTALKTKFKAVAFNINQIHKPMSKEVNEKIEALETKSTSFFEKILALLKPKAEDPQDPPQEPTEVETLKAENEALKSQVAEMQAKIDEATAKAEEMEAIKAQMESIKAEAEAIKTEVAAFRSTYKPEDRTQQVKSENKSLEDRKAEYEAYKKAKAEKK